LKNSAALDVRWREPVRERAKDPVRANDPVRAKPPASALFGRTGAGRVLLSRP